MSSPTQSRPVTTTTSTSTTSPTSTSPTSTSPTSTTGTARRPLHARLVTTVVVAIAGVLVLGALAAPAQAQRYTPEPGVTFNHPLSRNASARNAILDKVLGSVAGSPSGSTIRFASWNIRGSRVVDALVAAHVRGVTVRVIMDKKNAYRGNRNREVNRLQAELQRHGNGRRSPETQSGLRKCKASCRGRSGFAHSKFFLFSKAGKARQVVINSSSNATDLATGNQWNDAWTSVGDQGLYDAFVGVFDEMYLDQPVDQSYTTATSTSGTTVAEFFPYHGAGTEVDPVIRELQQVGCRGATNAPDGRTRLQISMTSWFGERGIAIARRVVALSKEGCRFKILYAVAGNEVRRLLRRNGIPIRHIVQDFDRDGVYDRYLHQKVLTIRGTYAGNPGSWITVNGSSNWSPLSLLSDEATLRISDPATLKKYNRYIDRLFRNPPRNPNQGGSGGGAAGGAEHAAYGGTHDPMRDPAYAQVQVD